MQKRIKAKKYLGQHFLDDLSIAKQIVSLSTSQKANVLEVGPGMGMLTQFIIEKDWIVKVIEIDIDCVNFLIEKYQNSTEIIQGNFLSLDLKKIFDSSFVLIGNFPYNISSPILFRIFENRDSIDEIIGMFQKEIAERIAIKKGKKRGILSVLLQAFYTIEYCFTVHPNAFTPPPKINSGVVKMKRNTRLKLDCDEDLFIKIVKAGFNQKRKLLRNALKTFTFEKNHEIDNLLLKRAEQLSVNQFVKLTQNVQKI